MNLLNLFGKKTFPHGIHPDAYKEETNAKITRRLPFADEIVVPLAQSIGRPAKAIVFRGQHIIRGEVIAEADGFMSVPIHAPVSGTIKEIDIAPTAKGGKQPAIIITTSLNSGQQVLDSGERNDYLQMTREELVKAVQNTGLVGLGGAAFPTHVKMAIPPDRSIHTVLVNGCECEPFLTTDHRVMLEKIDNLLLGIRIAMKTVDAPRAIIGIEDNKLNVLEAIKPYLPDDDSITIEAVETKYPQGAEKMLAYSLLGIEIPSGGLPSEVGLAVFNVATLAELGALLPAKQGLIERIITITGDGVKKPGNYLAPIGTPVRFLLEYAEFIGAEAELILGGPMMGMPARSLDVPITKGTGALLVLDKRATKRDDILSCIKCTQCLQACPINLNPSELGLLATKRQYDVMEEKYHLNDCFECGCCSYVCPSNIPLVQYFRIAKALNRERHLQNS
ncbi:electron transport complex protein RnfC [Bathymodiolus japonicus methanotrophic gill symbiont]|uniref:electron transport complex subunit RsxC n=1 Tax=Bathymodiolus japonicus methanotrophic gill symbiont TaxID=113269 RepID=UPI001B438F46|nr:electron transport complex subunit RsxC [Bathymodiolus japonicus methanotrophic gill symbiont]GFO71451.1 electron transport complex protein RnfC [Bathymodiolus japonicus methanotrophic gill symbiont]